MGRRFQKRIEAFICQHCGYEVKGNGFTNHCPRCLWSRHVDLFPGDRGASCQGMMEPVDIEKKGQEISVIHRCLVCGERRKNKLAPDDDYQKVLEIMTSMGQG